MFKKTLIILLLILLLTTSVYAGSMVVKKNIIAFSSIDLINRGFLLRHNKQQLAEYTLNLLKERKAIILKTGTKVNFIQTNNGTLCLIEVDGNRWWILCDFLLK